MYVNFSFIFFFSACGRDMQGLIVPPVEPSSAGESRSSPQVTEQVLRYTFLYSSTDTTSHTDVIPPPDGSTHRENADS